MLKKYYSAADLFLRSSNFYRGLLQTLAAVSPLVILYYAGYFEYAVGITLGAMLNAPSNIPGSPKRRVYGILVSIALTIISTTLVLYAKPYFWLLLFTLLVLGFLISLVSVYGFRGSLISFSGLLAMVLALAKGVDNIPLHGLLIGIGGLWYLFLAWLFYLIAPKKDEDQMLSDTLYLTGSYLKARGILLSSEESKSKAMQDILELQTKLTEKHQVLRELLLTTRKKGGISNFDDKRVLIFVSLIDILELAMANNLAYSKIESQFADRKNTLLPFQEVNKVMGNHLQHLSSVILNKEKIPAKEILLNALEKALHALQEFRADIPLPEGRESMLTLRNLYDYQEQQIAKIRDIRRVMANVKHHSKFTANKEDAAKFIPNQEYGLHVIYQNLSLKSPIFRHAIRLACTMVFAYIFGTLIGIVNAYWIILTVIVIMRPNYGLTKERSINRIIGTLIGAAFATLVILTTDNTIVYGVIAAISMTFAFALIQQSYRTAAAFITLNIIFVYALIDPDSFKIIQFRVIDTCLGAAFAVIANYTILPSWEHVNFTNVLKDALIKNRDYLIAVKDLYQSKEISDISYKIPRKEAFLAISNLNAAFQRMTQDPKSQQKNPSLIYTITTLNNTFLSSLAAMGTFIQNHKTTEASTDFATYILGIQQTLENTIALLDAGEDIDLQEQDHIIQAEKKLQHSYRSLVEERNKEIEEGKMSIETQMRLHLQEAHLIYNQLIWLKNLSENIAKSTQEYRLMGS